MGGRRRAAVPITCRFLAARPVRTAADAVGIGMALMLMLLLAGLWAGVRERVTTYDDHLGADLVVVPVGTESLFAEPGLLPAPSVRAVRATEGVDTAAALRTRYLILELSHGKAAVAAVASDPSGRLGGPWDFARGSPPQAPNEVAVDALFADQHGLSIGDLLPMLGHPMRVVGLTEDTDMFMTPLVFTTTEAMDEMLASPDTTGAVLITTSDAIAVSDRLRRQGYTVRTPGDLRRASLTQATRIFGSPVRLMIAVAFAAGTLIVALVSSSRLAEQQRDLGVLKALGATPRRVGAVAFATTGILTGLGALTAVVLLIMVRELLAWWRPAFPVELTAMTLAGTAAAAAAMALLAAWLPARRLARLDAASAFRSHP